MVPLEQMVLLGLLELQVVLLVFLDQAVPQVQTVYRVPQVLLMELQVQAELQEFQEQMVLRVLPVLVQVLQG
jgi:hypothetical protein